MSDLTTKLTETQEKDESEGTVPERRSNRPVFLQSLRRMQQKVRDEETQRVCPGRTGAYGTVGEEISS